MALLDHVKSIYDTDRIIEVGPWTVLVVLADGSAFLYRNPMGTIERVPLSQFDIKKLAEIFTKLQGGTMYKVAKIIETCNGCPSQWSAKTDDGVYVYIRYRHGFLRVDIDGETVYEDNFTSESGGDGAIDFYEMAERTKGVLDFEGVIWVEDRKEVEG